MNLLRRRNTAHHLRSGQPAGQPEGRRRNTSGTCLSLNAMFRFSFCNGWVPDPYLDCLICKRIHNPWMLSVFFDFLPLLRTLKGILSFLKAYNNKYLLSVHALMVFTIFCFIVDEKIKFKVLACFFESGDFGTEKNVYRRRL